MNLLIRHAALEDVPGLTNLIALSARQLSCGDYTPDQVEAALGTAWGVDTQLIRDQTFFVVTEGSQMVACGGWSKRKKLFGAGGHEAREPERLDPSRDAARIRAFFVHSDWARRGIGRMLLEKCESEARLAGFRSAELVATLPGERLYRAFGYTPEAPIQHALREGLSITFVPMRKGLLDA